MADGQDYSKYQRGVIHRYYEHVDTIALQRLSEIVSDLYMAEGGNATKLWNSARQALTKLTPVDDPRVSKVLSVRSVTGLAKLVSELSAGAKATGNENPSTDTDLDEPVVGAGTPPPVIKVAPPPLESKSPAAPPTTEDLKNAMRAFRKRLKLTKLDDESKLGRVGNPMSGGKKSQVLAIMAPREYPQAVWDELVKQGRLRKSGQSFYELSDGT